MPRKRSANEKYHDRVAGRYDAVYNDAYWQWHDALTWDYLKRHLPRDLRAPIIDLGCGTGKWGRKLLKSGYAVTFSDLSHKMLDSAARGQVLGNEGDARAEFIQADLEDLSALPRDQFALALAMGEPICCAANPQRAMREISNILSTGGVLVATFDHRIACIDHYVEAEDADELAKFLRTGRTRWLTRDRDEQFELHTFELPELRRLFEAAGLNIVEVVGKTVLPMRRFRHLLEDPARRRAWQKIEESLSRDEVNLGRCAHLQIAARKT